MSEIGKVPAKLNGQDVNIQNREKADIKKHPLLEMITFLNQAS